MKKTCKTDFRIEKSAFYACPVKSGYIIKGEVWLEKNGRVFMDSNRVKLLCLVDKLGSLAAAARFMGLGYNSAWLWITEMNQLSANPLVERTSGGVKGGYSILTRHGRKIIDEYHKLNYRLQESVTRVMQNNVITGSKPGKEAPGKTTGLVNDTLPEVSFKLN